MKSQLEKRHENHRKGTKNQKGGIYLLPEQNLAFSDCHKIAKISTIKRDNCHKNEKVEGRKGGIVLDSRTITILIYIILKENRIIFKNIFKKRDKFIIVTKQGCAFYYKLLKQAFISTIHLIKEKQWATA